MEFLELQLSDPITSFRFQSLLVSSAAGGSVLTLIAVLAAAAAAVGFWRIRVGGSKDCESVDDAPILATGSNSEGAYTQQKAAPLVRSTETAEEASVSPSCSDVDRPIEIVGSPKIRFTAYFEEEEDLIIGCCHVEDTEEVDEEILLPEVVCQRREHAQLLPRKGDELDGVRWESIRGDLGWYSYQDMAALNGSVVRLWDGGISPRRRIKGSFAIPSF